MVPALLSLIAAAHAQSVLLLRQDDSPVEARFHEELALSVDAVLTRPCPTDFAVAPMTIQLDGVRALLLDAETSGVVWLDASNETVLRVLVAFVENDRAVIRLLDVPRTTGAEAHLAVATRELLSALYLAEPVLTVALELVEPEPTVPLRGSFSGILTAPTTAQAGGVRYGLSAGVSRLVGAVDLGLALEGETTGDQHRLGPSAWVQRGALCAGVSAQVTWLPWHTQVQPRVFAGLLWPRESEVHLEGRLALTPIRDTVERGTTVLYNSGWVEAEVRVRWSPILSVR